MIRSLRVRNFKCFRDETLRFSPLTLVVGGNGGGKTSLLQALLLLQQTRQARGGYVQLNGPFHLRLGSAADALCHTAGAERAIVFELEPTSGETTRFQFNVPSPESLVLDINPAGADLPWTAFTYLSAERLGPRDTLETDSRPADELEVGVQGEFTAQVLALRERDRVRDELRHPRTESAGNLITLAKQVELWMGDLVPGIEIRTEAFLGTNLSALRLRRGQTLTTEWLRPPNLGFGVSYALPVVVGGLLAAPGTLFLVENPEAHLHPAGQSQMGRFLATLAAAGIQVVIETHSDHVLNGVRLAAVDSRHPLPHEEVSVQFFHGREEAENRAEEIGVNAKGGLTSWPHGFFDQSEKDLAGILEARRRG